MLDPTNRLAGLLHRLEELLPSEYDKECAREWLFLHVFFPYHSDAELRRRRGTYRHKQKIRRWGEAHCANMVLMIDGYLALRELGLADYIKPRGRKPKKSKP